MDWLKTLSKWELPALMFIAGFLILYFSFFLGLPNPGNTWTPQLRERSNVGLLLLGICFCGGSVGLTLLLKRFHHEATRSPLVVEEPPADPKQHPAVLQWFRLSPTQKELVVFLYEHSHREKLPFDDLYSAFCSKHGTEVVPRSDEMFFRLKSLDHIGFLKMEAVAEKATDIRKIREIKIALLNGDIINTGG